MEPQVTICCNGKNQKCCCLYRILYLIIGLFTFVLGIIIGALTGFVEAIGAVYLYAVGTILVVLALLVFMYIICNCRRN